MVRILHRNTHQTRRRFHATTNANRQTQRQPFLPDSRTAANLIRWNNFWLLFLLSKNRTCRYRSWRILVNYNKSMDSLNSLVIPGYGHDVRSFWGDRLRWSPLTPDEFHPVTAVNRETDFSQLRIFRKAVPTSSRRKGPSTRIWGFGEANITSTTVDGRNPAPVDRWFIRWFIGVWFNHPKLVVQDFIGFRNHNNHPQIHSRCPIF